MSHEYKDSIKSDIKYCINCGCLSYKNILAKNINLADINTMKLDPLILKYRPISLKLNFSSIYHMNYIAHRKFGLLKIYDISKRFNLPKSITFKAIGLMDKIYLNNENIRFIENLETISLICLVFSFQFNNYEFSKNENCKNRSIISRKYKCKNQIYECYQYIKTEVKDLIYWEIICLKYLCFNLGEFTAFDYINLFFHLGIIFTKEDFDISNNYKNCINLLEIIINNYNICNYNQYVIALSIIYVNFHNVKYFSNDIFKYIYGVDFTKKKYQLCLKDINKMINDIYQVNINNNAFNRSFINSGNRLNNFIILEHFSNYYINNNSEKKEQSVLNILYNFANNKFL